MTDAVENGVPGTDLAPDSGYWAERRRYVKAFVDRGGAVRRRERLRAKPLAVAGVITVTLVAGLAVGALPRLLRSSGGTSSTGGSGSPLAALGGHASGTPSRDPSAAGIQHGARATNTPQPVPAPVIPGSAAVPGTPAGTRTTPAVPASTHSATATSAAGSAAAARTTPATTPTAGHEEASPVNYQAVTGYGCPQPTDATSDVYGWYSQGDTGFFTVSSGSTTQSGCNGSFVAMPMSGSDATDNTENLAIWTFRFPAGSEACRVDVYIPDETSIVDVGGDPSLYTVYDNGSVVGSFYVDQVGQLGKWVTGGTFPISSGVMTLQVHSRGQDWVGNTVTNAHIAVAAASATCQPA